MLPIQRVEKRLQILNTALVPLLRGIHRYSSIWMQIRRISKNPLQTYITRDYTIAIIVADLPGSNPLLIAYYISTQSSRPISPSQLRKKMHRILQMLRHLRNKSFTAADILYIIYSPKGFTKGSKREARKHRINLAVSAKDLLSPLARYVSKRYTKLLERIGSKKVWGNVPLLIYALQEIGLSIGAKIRKSLDPPRLIELVTKGGHLHLA